MENENLKQILALRKDLKEIADLTNGLAKSLKEFVGLQKTLYDAVLDLQEWVNLIIECGKFNDPEKKMFNKGMITFLKAIKD